MMFLLNSGQKGLQSLRQGLIKDGKQIFHPAWFLAFLKETFHLNKNLMIQTKTNFIALFEKNY